MCYGLIQPYTKSHSPKGAPRCFATAPGPPGSFSTVVASTTACWASWAWQQRSGLGFYNYLYYFGGGGGVGGGPYYSYSRRCYYKF